MKFSFFEQNLKMEIHKLHSDLIFAKRSLDESKKKEDEKEALLNQIRTQLKDMEIRWKYQEEHHQQEIAACHNQMNQMEVELNASKTVCH